MISRMGQLFALLVCLAIPACATPPAKISQEKPVDEINNRQGVALEGYDPVAYFTRKQPTPGSPDIGYQWKGATYRFATAEDRDLFAASPEHYAPQFGGYCAYAVSLGTTADGDPFQWKVDGDKLFVNNNAIAAKLWNQNRARNIRLGTENWPLIPKQSLTAAAAGTSAEPGATAP